ncbi:hypothetical protein ABI59_08660 [Acidobacteria bacterium Mor1]|nr:hypothetical protein ABI59_08660 [Acidobacteria bacterium Mor1]
MARTLRVFISSTARDLGEHRSEVREVIDRLGHKAVGMETFGAQPSWSLQACRNLVEGCDALVVIVAHRYGWVPPTSEGSAKSITWHEVDAAQNAGLPIFTFLVDESAPWTADKEQDRLVGAAPGEVDGIQEAVQQLQAFKRELLRRPCDHFDSPEDLAKKVATSLSRWLTNATDPYLQDGWWVHPYLGMRIPAPDGWTAHQGVNNTPQLMGPLRDEFHDNFNVQQAPLPGTGDIQVLLAHHVQSVQQMPGVDVVRAEVRSIGGRDGIFVVYKGTVPGLAFPLCFAAVVLIKGGREVIVTATVKPSRWDEVGPQIEQALTGIVFGQ